LKESTKSSVKSSNKFAGKCLIKFVVSCESSNKSFGSVLVGRILSWFFKRNEII
jgi:hypothetical protein